MSNCSQLEAKSSCIALYKTGTIICCSLTTEKRDNRWTINILQAIAASYKESSPLDLVKHKNNLTYFLSNNLTRIIQR